MPHVPTAREMMTRKLVTLRPDLPAVDAATVLLKHGISGAPVVDEDGHLLGLLSEYDCLRAVASADYEMDSHDSIEFVGELMSTDCVTIGPEMGLFAIAHEFVVRRMRRFPVIEDGKLIGQVSRRDALRTAVNLRKQMSGAHHHYPDYPEGRDPIRNYPSR
ncbi:MAG: CBS domain-containing protein [bacterium]|nr:CBS domain-containing protein [bacterium]MCP5069138.1 CBS domain-containing protein [bacterium]